MFSNNSQSQLESETQRGEWWLSRRCGAVKDNAINDVVGVKLVKSTRQQFLFLLACAALARLRNLTGSRLPVCLTGRKSTLWPWRRSVSTRLSSPLTAASWAPFWMIAANCCTRPSSATWQPRATRESTTSSITLPTATSWQLSTALPRFITLTCRRSVMGSTRCWMRGASDPPDSFTPGHPPSFKKTPNFPHITCFCFEGDNREHLHSCVPFQPNFVTEVFTAC